jgi:hypothetical protein
MNNQFRNVTEALHPLPSFRCPCCKFKTLCGRAQNEICKVCYWEDDGQDDHDANEVRGGPNGTLSLSIARGNFTAFGAVDRKYLPNVRQPLPNEI